MCFVVLTETGDGGRWRAVRNLSRRANDLRKEKWNYQNITFKLNDLGSILGPTLAQGKSVGQQISSLGSCHPSLPTASNFGISCFIPEGVLNICFYAFKKVILNII